VLIALGENKKRESDKMVKCNRQKISISRKCERYVARQISGTLTKKYSPFDIETDQFLFEVKSVSIARCSNPKIHIQDCSYEHKVFESNQSGKLPILAAVATRNGKPVGLRFAWLETQHIRYKALLTEREFIRQLSRLES
jgi:hypothetical protein